MSLPIHLQSIKSSGVYRFVYDKSVISGETAETLRLVVGYSDKGPFNTPVYITSRDEFIRTYGNISKRLEKKGVFFHRLALQALASGPILAMNLKPFDSESVKYIGFKASGDSSFLKVFDNKKGVADDSVNVVNLYDTNRFWTLDADKLATSTLANHNYITVAATDSKDASCSIIVRKATPTEYGLSIREYYAQIGVEMPEYLTPIQDDTLSDYFLDVYVFKGQFTEDLCKVGGPLERYFNVTGTGANAKISLEENFVDAFGEPADVLAALAADPASNYVVGYRGTTLPYFKNAQGSYASIDLLFNSGYSAHKMLMKLDEGSLESAATAAALRECLKVAEETKDTVAYYEKTTVEGVTGYGNGTVIGTAIADANVTKKIKAIAVEHDAPCPKTGVTATDPDYIKINTVTATSISPCYIEGYTYSTADWTFDNTASKCLGVITGAYGKGLQEALTNRVDVEYHYIVDTFGTVAGPQGASDKDILAAIAKKKDNAFAILNFPKVKDFTDSKYKPLGTIDFKEIIKDFPLPDDTDGASWIGYFTQIVLSDGTVKTTVPSAGLVSNLFMDKWSSRQPYYIVAGSTYGRLVDSTLVGPDYAFSKTDRDVLEPYGINVIVYEPRRGTYINSEQTAKQVPVSGLSKIHIRELVIYLQDEIAELLESYRWENNTQVLRDKIKAKADVILETVKNNGGVYDYLNVCDDSNNTPETIDNEFLVLDTHIEPARGAGKMVEQLFIYRTGEMRSTLLQG